VSFAGEIKVVPWRNFELLNEPDVPLWSVLDDDLTVTTRSLRMQTWAFRFPMHRHGNFYPCVEVEASGCLDHGETEWPVVYMWSKDPAFERELMASVVAWGSLDP